MKGYSQLTLPQRYEISALDKAGHGPSAIAAVVGVHRTATSRELKRNHSRTGYHPQAADRCAEQRRKDRCRPLKWTARCRQLVESKLRLPVESVADRQLVGTQRRDLDCPRAHLSAYSCRSSTRWHTVQECTSASPLQTSHSPESL